MKSSDYHKTYGLTGTIRGIGTNTELHFHFDAGKTRIPLELNIQGQALDAYLEVVPLRVQDPNDDRDLGLRIVIGTLPDEDYQPDPKAVGGNQGKVSVPDRFAPIAAPETDNGTFVSVKEKPVVSPPSEAKFDPGPAPELTQLPEPVQAAGEPKMKEVKEEEVKKEGGKKGKHR